MICKQMRSSTVLGYVGNRSRFAVLIIHNKWRALYSAITSSIWLGKCRFSSHFELQMYRSARALT